MRVGKRIAAALLCLLLCQGTALAADSGGTETWSRTEGDGSYVTIRVEAEEDLDWADSRYLAVRYADTEEPVALSSEYQDGYLFATVPAEEADRPLEVFSGDGFDWTDLDYPTEPTGTNNLQIRGIIQGDEAGRLNKDGTLTRAQAFAIMVRLLSLEPAGDPGYADVSPSDWYYDTVSAARAAGIAAADERFRPNDTVTRAEFTVMLARAMETIGWLEIPEEGDRSTLDLADTDDVPDWALGAYMALSGLCTVTYRETGEVVEGSPVLEQLAEPGLAVTRAEMIEFVYNVLRWLPVYPTEAAIELGFDEEMPVIDGSTSTYSYTTSLYGALFSNWVRHPQYPESHSKSHESYERLINGEVDVLFAATKASQELEALAEEQGVELEYIPIAYDAMVFFTNAENSITG